MDERELRSRTVWVFLVIYLFADNDGVKSETRGELTYE